MLTLEKIKQEVFSRRPVLAEIYKQHQQTKLSDYVGNFWQLPKSSPEPEFLNVVKAQAKKLYGPKTAEQIYAQLVAKPLVSTIDHHGFWNHPVFVNSALIYSLHFETQQLVITFPTESVSLNNASSWSASLLWHENLQLKRASVFSGKYKHLPVFATPPIGPGELVRVSKFSKGRLEGFLREVVAPALPPMENFSQQVAVISAKIWQAVFPAAPRLVYLPLETLVLDYLQKIFFQPEHLICRLIFTPQGRSAWSKFFAQETTFMFWQIKPNKQRQALKELPAEPAELLRLMNQRQIYPSSPLCFAVLLAAGLACVGGFTQTTWLTNTKDNLVKLFKELSLTSHAEQISLIPTKNFAESSLAWLSKQGNFLAPTAWDLYSEHQDYYLHYRQTAQDLTLGQSVELALPQIYEVVVPAKQRQNLLSAKEVQKQMLLTLNLK